MSTRLGVLGVPITPVTIRVNVAAGVSVATYSIPSPTVITGFIFPCVANYSVNAPTVQGQCNIYPVASVATYTVNSPTIIASANVFPTPCVAIYTCVSPIVLAGIVAYPQPCVANYSVNNPTVYGICTIPASTATANYLVNAPTVAIVQNIYPTPCVANYTCNGVIATGAGNVYPTPCLAAYSVNVPVVKGNANAIQVSCVATYSGITPSVRGICNEYPGVSVANYSINSPIVASSQTIYSDICSAIYTCSAVQISIGMRINAIPAIADYSVKTPMVGVLTVVYPTASSIEFYVSPYYQVSAGGIPNYKDISKMPTQWLRKCNGQNYDNERKLYRKLTTEAYNKFGVCMTFYVVSYDTQYDKIYGEDNDRRFIRKFDIMAYFPLQTEEKLWTKFAIEGTDNFSVFVSKDHFRTACTYGNTSAPGNKGKNTYPIYTPDRNDVLQSKFNGYLYEIVKVKEEAMMMHLSKRYVWEFILKPYIDEHHSIDTTVAGTSLENVRPYVDSTDILKVNAEAQAEATTGAYTPRSCEKPPAFPYGGW